MQTTATASNLNWGNYTVTVTDANGCTMIETTEVDSIVIITNVFDVISNVKLLELYPNPLSNYLNINLEINESKPISIDIVNNLGQVVYQKEEIITSNYVQKVDLTHLDSGVYYVRFRIDGSMFSRKIVVLRTE